MIWWKTRSYKEPGEDALPLTGRRGSFLRYDCLRRGVTAKGGKETWCCNESRHCGGASWRLRCRRTECLSDRRPKKRLVAWLALLEVQEVAVEETSDWTHRHVERDVTPRQSS